MHYCVFPHQITLAECDAAACLYVYSCKIFANVAFSVCVCVYMLMHATVLMFNVSMNLTCLEWD